MDITTDLDGSQAYVALAGSLNTNTASELEAALNPIIPQVNAIVFDFTNLEYVSSAGLRVLMMTFKRLGGSGVSIEHASDEVREVFDITGFSALFDIR